MSNKYVDLSSRATLLKNKLDILSKSLQNPTNFATKESYMAECSRILKSFYSQLDKPFFNFEEARRDNSLLPITNCLSTEKLDYDYNLMWDQLLDNLILLFMEMENLESLSVSNFNFAMTEANQLETRIKAVASKLGDYILYSQSVLSDVFLVKDSFNNLNKIDVQSPLLTEKECNVNQEEGIVTLPIIEQESKVLTVDSIPVLNDDSNGVSGNNQEIGKSHNGTISVLLDNNADTWYEYEKVVNKSSEDDPPLILDMVLDLGSPKIVNHIIVNPNNFGTRTALNIDAIETSMSGETFTSIKEDIPITGATYETADEQDVFTLAPATSQYAGQGIYTFTPRKTRYIHIILRQSEPYIIQTTSGEKLRYAIGIRDITVKALRFESKGELISSTLSCPKEIRKIMLEGNQVPKKDSELTNISYLLSHDNGITWNAIQKKEETGVSGIESVPEILNYNNSNPDSIKTKTPVASIRLKMILEREDGNFKEGVSSLFKKIKTISEIQGVPMAAPFVIDLDHGPVEGTVVLVDPLFGSRGIKESSYYIKYNQNQSEDTFIGLPFKNIKVPVEKNASFQTVQQSASSWLYVYVGGERWHQRTKAWKDYEISPEVADLEAYKATAPDSSTSSGDSSSFAGLAGNANYQSSGGVVNPENAFDGNLETFTALTDITVINNVHVDFIVNVPNVVKLEMYMPSPSSTGATVGRWTEEDQGALSDKVSSSFSGELAGWKLLYGGSNNNTAVTITKVGWAINQGSVGSYEDRVSAFRITLQSGDVIILDHTSQALALEETYNKLIDSNPQVLTVFDFNPLTGELSFSPDGSYEAEQPPENAPISMHFGAERLLPGPRNNDHIANLDFPTSNSKEDFTILRYEEISDSKQEILRPGATRQELEYKNITEVSYIVEPWSDVDFINGKDEFTSLADRYSIDKEGGVVYFSQPMGKGKAIVYKYQLVHELRATDWDWSGDGLLRKAITIKNSGWVEMNFNSITPKSVSQVDTINLEKLAITKGSLAISTASGDDAFFKEVAYINGTSEFASATTTSRQYSVNYSHGELYLSHTFSGNYSHSYAYTNYQAKYRIARKVNPTHYTVNIPKRKIAIKDSEFFKYLETPNTTQSGKAAYYLINYDYVSETREDVEELKDYFTPVVKDYILKILKKGNLF